MHLHHETERASDLPIRSPRPSPKRSPGSLRSPAPDDVTAADLALNEGPDPMLATVRIFTGVGPCIEMTAWIALFSAPLPSAEEQRGATPERGGQARQRLVGAAERGAVAAYACAHYGDLCILIACVCVRVARVQTRRQARR